MNLGAEPKKVAILAAIVGAGLIYYFWPSGDSSTAEVHRTAGAVPVAVMPAGTVSRAPKTQARVSAGEFRPRVLGSRADDKLDPSAIDPELKLDLLAKVQAVPPIAAGRNLFQFGAAPVVDKPLPAVPKNVPTVAINRPAPPPPGPVLNTPAGPPPAPPINLKYYGFQISNNDGRKIAFLLDGEDILLGQENQTLKQRYRIVHIARTSIDIEDTQAKSTQTLKLQDVPS